MRTFAVLFLLSVLVSGCCAPGACLVARSRFSELQPVIDQLLLFEQKEGRFPSDLEEAFPSGLPTGLVKLRSEPALKNARNNANYEFSHEKGQFLGFSYASLLEGGHLTASQERDKAFEGHYALDFNYIGGGLISSMMDCNWATNTRVWRCSGYM
jgi:hypothetical protein